MNSCLFIRILNFSSSNFLLLSPPLLLLASSLLCVVTTAVIVMVLKLLLSAYQQPFITRPHHLSNYRTRVCVPFKNNNNINVHNNNNNAQPHDGVDLTIKKENTETRSCTKIHNAPLSWLPHFYNNVINEDLYGDCDVLLKTFLPHASELYGNERPRYKVTTKTTSIVMVSLSAHRATKLRRQQVLLLCVEYQQGGRGCPPTQVVSSSLAAFSPPH